MIAISITAVILGLYSLAVSLIAYFTDRKELIVIALCSSILTLAFSMFALVLVMIL